MIDCTRYLQESDLTKNVKNIAFVGNTSFSLYKFRLGVMKSFFDLGYNVYAIAPVDEYSPLFANENIEFVSINIDTKGKNIFSDVKFTYGLYQTYKKLNIDFIFHYTIKPNIYGSLASRFLSIPSVAITTGLGFSFNKNNLFTTFIKFLYKLSLKKTKEVWFLNSNDKAIFIQNKIITDDKAFILHSEGIDARYYSPTPKANNNEPFRFLLLSRLIKEKGIEEYVAAAEILRAKGYSVEFQILGKQERESSKSISIDAVKNWHEKGSINYLGESIDVRKYIANSDCVVLPSFYMEGVPRCLMEAMSMERPIITTNNVGCNELIVDGVNGLRCEPRNIEDLAIKLEEMLKLSLENRKVMGENGRKLILEKFDELKIIKEYHNKFISYFITSDDKCIYSTVLAEHFRNITFDRNPSTIKSSFRNTVN